MNHEHTPTPQEIDDIIDGDEVSDDVEIGDEDFDNSFGEYDPMQALGQLFVNSEGETMVDVLSGIRDTLDKGTKILYKIHTTLEKKNVGSK